MEIELSEFESEISEGARGLQSALGVALCLAVGLPLAMVNVCLASEHLAESLLLHLLVNRMGLIETDLLKSVCTIHFAK